MVPRAPVESRDHLTAVARRMGSTAALLLPVAMGLVFYRQLIEFRDPFATWTEDANLLVRQTAWGQLWLWGVAGSFATPVLFLASATGTASSALRRAAWWPTAIVVLLMCAFPAYSGHAAGTDTLRVLSLPADVIHVLAAGSWVGGLLFVILAERALLPTLVPLFSPIALASVAALIVTGTIGSWLHLDSLAALGSTSYGRLLLLKIVLVLGVLALGAINWKKLTPRLREAGGPAELRRAATFELLLAHVVILITALLVRTSPLHDWSWSNIGH